MAQNSFKINREATKVHTDGLIPQIIIDEIINSTPHGNGIFG